MALARRRTPAGFGALRPSAILGDARAAGLVAAVGAALGVWAVAVTAGPPALRLPLAAGAAAALVVAVVGDARRVFLAVVILDVPLEAGRFFDWQTGPADLGAIGGLEVSATTVAVACLWAMRLVDPPAPLGAAARREVWRIALPLGLFLAAAVISTALAQASTLSLFEIAMLAQSYLVFLYVATSLRERRDILFAVAVLLAGLVVEGLLALSVLVGGPRLSFAGIETTVLDDGGLQRFGGTVGSPNNAAAYFGMLLVVAVATTLAPADRRLRILGGVALVLGGLGLVTTLGRGGWLAFGASVVVFALVGRRRGWLRLRIRPAVVAVVLVFAAAFGGLVATRLTANDQGAAQSRVPLLYVAVDMIRDHPLGGVGANNYAVAAAPYRTRDIAYQWNYTVHDKYLLVWSETGLLGLVPFVWFLIATLWLGIRCSRGADPVLRVLALGLACGVLGNMVHMNMEILNGRPQVQGLWLVAGLIAAIAARDAGGAATRGEVVRAR